MNQPTVAPCFFLGRQTLAFFCFREGKLTFKKPWLCHVGHRGKSAPDFEEAAVVFRISGDVWWVFVGVGRCGAWLGWLGVQVGLFKKKGATCGTIVFVFVCFCHLSHGKKKPARYFP